MKTSKILFLILLIIFISVGTYLILLSQGFVLDFQKFQIVKTGAIFLPFEPRDAKIMINGKIQKISPSFFNNYILIDQLIPNSYEIALFKEGFYKWQKKVKIEPSLVKEFQKVVLIPKEIKTTTTTDITNIDDFAITERGIVYKKGDNLFYNKNLLKGKQILVTEPRSPIVISSDKDTYFLTDINNLKSTLNLTELFNSLKQNQLKLEGKVTIKKIWIHPFSQNKIILATDAAVYELDTKKIKLEVLLFFDDKTTANSYNQNELVFVDSKGNLIFYNFLFKNKTIRPTNLNTTISKIEINQLTGDIGLLTENGDFLIYNRSKNKIIETPFKKVSSFLFSNNGQDVIVIDKNKKVKIFSLTKNKFWKLSLPPYEIKNITPITYLSNYFLAIVENDLILSEIQSGYPTNWYPLIKSVKKYQFQDKNLYILKDNGEFLTLPPLLSSSRFP